MNSLPSLPPDPASSPSLPFRPFSRLPTELVQFIIELTVPLTFHSNTYHSRQTTLRSVALVSRLFHQLASSILFAVTKFKRPSVLTKWQDVVNSKHIGTTREFVVQGAIDDWFPPLDLPSLFAAFVNVQLLVFNQCDGAFDMSLIGNLTNLSSLRLSECVVNASRSFVLAQLEELQMLYVQHDKPLHEIFSPTSTPRLRALAIYNSVDPIDGLSNLLGHYVAQLEAISLDHNLLVQISPKILPEILAKTLLDQGIASPTDLPHSPSLRLFSSTDPDVSGVTGLSIEQIRLLDRNLLKKTSETTPSILYLPPVDTRYPFGTRRRVEVVEKLSSTCKSLEIELVFEMQPQDWTLDSGISRDFWRRMKELKAKGGKE